MKRLLILLLFLQITPGMAYYWLLQDMYLMQGLKFIGEQTRVIQKNKTVNSVIRQFYPNDYAVGDYEIYIDLKLFLEHLA